MTTTRTRRLSHTQQRIIDELGVPADFDAVTETERRVEFLAEYLRRTGAAGYVLGISGGVDSTTGGRLAQLAVERLRGEGREAAFVAVRLPYQVQADEADAQVAIAFVGADEVLTVNIAEPTDTMVAAVRAGGVTAPSDAAADFVKGNVKARQRMIAQYTVAGARNLLVIGTDHAAEAVTGFYTKYGDGACDLTPLAGLTKRRVRAIAAHLGAPATLVAKIPTADLEDGKPGNPDEVALGVTYEAIDTYLEGGEVADVDRETIEGAFARTAHKRAMPVTPDDLDRG
ncbi:ammonia-dependent NAD(+) synthetase [Occultella glacieicola]|uniref:ammonia-dependent NAD(+) synthetase n=1 Tax=Occultella glacieicola TaxID=2518684 RepID=UPI001F39B52E|nr:ammonia-dependent NAD(+) synthetase [Occultella glacieicola]